MENGHIWPFILDFPIKMVIFYSYVNLPEGKGLNVKAEPYIPTPAARLTSELYTTKDSHRRLQIALNQSSDR